MNRPSRARKFLIGAMLIAVVVTGAVGRAGLVGVGFGPDGNLYVTDHTANTIAVYNGATGEFMKNLVTGGTIGEPAHLIFSAGGQLYLNSQDTNGVINMDAVLRFDSATGNPFPSAGNTGATFALGAATGIDFTGLTFGPGGHLYVAGGETHSVFKFDGVSGAALGTFAVGGGLIEPQGLAFGPDGHLYVTSGDANPAILRFDGLTGAFLATVVSGLAEPTGLTFGSDGNLYVSDTANILRFDPATGAPLPSPGNTGAIFATGGLVEAQGLVFGPGGNLFVIDGRDPGAVFRFDGLTGAALGQFTSIPEPATYAALASGILLLCGLCHMRRRCGRRPSSGRFRSKAEIILGSLFQTKEPGQ